MISIDTAVLEIKTDLGSFNSDLDTAGKSGLALGETFKKISALFDASGQSVTTMGKAVLAMAQASLTPTNLAAAAMKDLTQTMKDAQSAAGGLADAAKAMGASWVAHIAEAILLRDAIHDVINMAVDGIKAFPDLVEHSISVGNALYEMSLKTGASVENLSALRFVASQTGIDFESFGSILFKMQQAFGASGEKADTLSHDLAGIGLSLQTLKNEKPDQAFIDIMSALEQMPNRADQARIGVEVFGRGFKDMAGLTQESIKGLIKEANDLGLVMTTDQAAAAHAAEVGWNSFTMQLEAMAMSIAQTVVPALVALESVASDAFKAIADDYKRSSLVLSDDAVNQSVMKMGETLIADAAVMAGFAQGSIDGAKLVVAAITRIGEAWVNVGYIAIKVLSLGTAGDTGNGVAAKALRGLEDSYHALQILNSGFDTVADAASGAFGKAEQVADSMAGRFGEAFTKAKKTIDDFAAKSHSAVGGIGQDVEGSGKAAKSALSVLVESMKAGETETVAFQKGFEKLTFGIDTAGKVVQGFHGFLQAVMADMSVLLEQMNKITTVGLKDNLNLPTADRLSNFLAGSTNTTSAIATTAPFYDIDALMQKLTTVGLGDNKNLPSADRIGAWLKQTAPGDHSEWNPFVDDFEAALEKLPGVLATVFDTKGGITQALKNEARSLGTVFNKSLNESMWQAQESGSVVSGASLASAGALGAVGGISALASGASALDALKDVGLTATRVLMSAAAAAGEMTAGAVALGATTFGIGAAAIVAYEGLKKMFSLSPEYVAAKNAQADIVKQLQAMATQAETTEGAQIDAYHAIAIVGRDAFDQIGLSAANTDKLVSMLLNTKDVQNFTTAAAALEQVVKAENDIKTGISGLQSAFSAAGTYIPMAMRNALASMANMKGLTDDEKQSIDDLVSQATPSFDDLTQVADKYGLTIDQLGPKFEQMQSESDAKSLYNDFMELNDAGADTGSLLTGMAGKFNDLVHDSQTYGTAIPDNMKPILQMLADQGQLTDENGNKLTTLAGLTFEDTPLDKGLTALQTAMDTLNGTLESLQAFLDAINSTVLNPKTITIHTIFGDTITIPNPNPSPNPPGPSTPPANPTPTGQNATPQDAPTGDNGGSGYFPEAAGGDFKVSRPTLFLAGEAGPEEAVFSGANKSLGDGADRPPQNSYVLAFGDIVLPPDSKADDGKVVIDTFMNAMRFNTGGARSAVEWVADQRIRTLVPAL